jgi:predicted negative regulator of RcsB-dependent stress response
MCEGRERKMLKGNIVKLLQLAVTLWGCCAAAQQPAAPALPPHDQVQDCLRKLWAKPVFWDSRAVAPVDPSVCGAPPGKIEDTLKAQHLSVFHLANAVFLTSADLFTPNRMGFYYRWKIPSINIRVLPLTLDESRSPSDAELRQITEAILQRSHLTPLTCPFDDNSDGIGELALSIEIDIHKMHIGSPRESVVALVVNTDPQQDRVAGTGRIIYGELEDGGFKYLWETPLLYSSFGQWGYDDLLRNGNLQISMTTSWGSSGQYTLFYAFDLDGREITRQNDTCQVMDEFALDHNRNATVCPVYADSVDVVATAKGPKDLRIVDSSANQVDPTKSVKKLRYTYKDGHYQVAASAPVKGTASLSVAAINEQGTDLMKEGKFQEASDKFYEAYLRNDSTAQCLYTNNLGFADYKMGKYEEAVEYLKETTHCDSTRAVAYLNLGDAYAKLNRNADARQAYEKYLELTPDSKSAADVKKKLDALPPSP